MDVVLIITKNVARFEINVCACVCVCVCVCVRVCVVCGCVRVRLRTFIDCRTVYSHHLCFACDCVLKSVPEI